MIEYKNTILSSEIKDEMFACDIIKCKGACCVEGDLGAPLEKEEIEIIVKEYKNFEGYLSEKGKQAVEEQGKYILDEEGDLSTPTIGGKECAYAVYDEKGILKCGIEQAYFDKKTTFRKPISCHLYPIRVRKYDEFEALNYDRWSICSDACVKGKREGIPIYKFTKDALIRKYGQEWYDGLLEIIEE